MGQDNKIDVSYVATLARLDIDEKDKADLQKDLQSIVSYIEKLGELDVSGIEPTAHASCLSNVWREDEAKESYPRDKMLANAPGLIDENLIKVAQVLPGEGMN